MKVTELQQLFYRRCAAENLSINTIKTYNYLHDRFAAYCIAHDAQDVSRISADTVRSYLQLCYHAGYSPVTVLDVYRSINAMMTFAAAEHITDGNVMDTVKRPKIPKVTARSFEPGEIDAIFDTCDKDTFVGYRNYTIFCMFLATGMRKSELLGLSISDVDLVSSYIRVVGKGNKERYIPIAQALRRVITRYLTLRGEFISSRKKSRYTQNMSDLWVTKDCRKLTCSGLDEVFRKLKRKLSIPAGRLSPHTFRHTFAINFLMNGGNSFALKEILGHESISTTQIYVKYTETGLRSEIEKFNPLSNKTYRYK